MHISESEVFPPADAVLAAPLTFNTIHKWACGINDTVALGLLHELLSSEPQSSPCHASNQPYKPIRHMRPTCACLRPLACGSSTTRSSRAAGTDSRRSTGASSYST